jgi:hypothetical protein
VHCGRARFDHGFHQLKGVQGAAKAGFRVRYNGGQPVDTVAPLGVMHLISSQERVVDGPDHMRDAIDRIETLVRVHLSGGVGVAGRLPPAQIDRLQSGLDLLHRLVTGEGAQGGHVRLSVQQLPQSLGS